MQSLERRLSQGKGERAQEYAPGIGALARVLAALGRHFRIFKAATASSLNRIGAPVRALTAPNGLEPHPRSGATRDFASLAPEAPDQRLAFMLGIGKPGLLFRSRYRVPELLGHRKMLQDVLSAPLAIPSMASGVSLFAEGGRQSIGRHATHPLIVIPLAYQLSGLVYRLKVFLTEARLMGFSLYKRYSMLLLLLCSALSFSASAVEIREVKQPPRYQWKEFIKVAGQPEPVPVEWISTPEGKFAHSIVIPNPVPEDSGYRWWWSAKRYHQHLCEKEAGEFIFKTVDGVEGLLFMRPPGRPTDYDLMDVRKLEAPAFENGFGTRPYIGERGGAFVGKDRYIYVEEPAQEIKLGQLGYLHASGPLVRPHFWLRDIKSIPRPVSRYGVTWRGIVREKDRNHAISGHEIIVIDLRTNEVLGIARDFGITGFTRGRRDGIWWLNAPPCSQFSKKYTSAGKEHLVDFVVKVLKPTNWTIEEIGK